MAKKKYYYAIVEKENGNLYQDSGRLPIFFDKQVAKELISEFNICTDTYMIHPISINGLEDLILGIKRK